MKSNVVVLDCVTTLDLSAARVLSAASEWVDPDRSMAVMGFDKETGELAVASNLSAGAELNLLLDRAKLYMLEALEE